MICDQRGPVPAAPDLVAPLQPCCGKTRQSKRPLSVLTIPHVDKNNLLSSLFIYPSGESINSEQKNYASKQPSFEHLHVWMVKFEADILSVMLKRTG
jgi:hypothetical protein